MLTTTVERLEGNNIKLTVTIPAEDVNAAIAEAYTTISSKLKIPGFRKGKAPRPVVDNYVGREYVLAEATEELVNKTYPKALDAELLRPIESPELAELETVTQGEPYTFVAEVTLRPEFTVESYEGLIIDVPRRVASDADIDAQIDELRDRFASLEPVEDRGVTGDDFVLISFTGYVDGEEYEGNTVDKYLYEMSRGLMPVEFDEGLNGLKAGDETRIEFVIPENSSNEEFKGKMAQFDVTVHEVKAKKLPEVDDDFASEMGFESVQLMRDDLRSRLDLQRLLAYNQAKEKGAREALASRTPGEIPEPMVKQRMGTLETDFNTRLSNQGMTLEQYAEMTGLTREVFEESIKTDAEQLIREDLALEALFRQLGYEVSDEDMDQELEEIARASQISVEEAREKWESLGLTAVIAEGVQHRRAVGWLMENVEVNEVDDQVETPEAKADDEGTKKTTKKRAPKAKKSEDAEPATEDAAAE